MCYDYNRIQREDKRKKNFNLDKAATARVLGKREDWEAAMAKTLFTDPKSEHIWEETPEGKRLVTSDKYNWIRKGDRSHVKNMWEVMKKLMREISKDGKATGGNYNEYDRVQLTHFLFAISVLDVRKTLDSDNYTGQVDDYANVVLAFEQIFSWIERNTIIPAKLDQSFSPNRMLKVLGMALNMKISNYFDYFENWRPQFFNEDMFRDFSRGAFKTEQDIIDTNQGYQDYLAKMREEEKIYGMLLYEVEQFLVTPEREEENIELFKSTFIEDQRTARDQWPNDLPHYEYKPTQWKKETATAVDRELAQMLMIVPKEVEDLHQLELEEQDKPAKEQKKIEDKRSQLPIQKVYRFFEDLERFLIAEPEPMQLIMGIANNEPEVWTLYK